MNKCLLLAVAVASLLSACASKSSGPASTQTSAVGGCCVSEKTPTQAQRDYAAKTAASVPTTPPAQGDKPSKVKARVTDSTQVETVRETKPVISDDSELRK